MKINTHTIKAERAKRAWTQQHLADVSGISLRTIQRIESTAAGGPESIKALAAAFDLTPDAFLAGANSDVQPASQPWYRRIRLESKTTAMVLSVMGLLTLPVFFLSSNDAIGNAEYYRFEGGIRVDDSPLHEFGVELRADQLFILDVDARHKLIMEAGDNGEGAKTTTIRLLQNDGKSYTVMHRSVSQGPDNHLKSVSYRICGDDVIYYGPAVASIPDCNESPTHTAAP